MKLGNGVVNEREGGCDERREVLGFDNNEQLI